MLASVTHILPLTTIRRERALRQPGKVLVRKGQKVNANDIVAETNLAPEHILLDIARSLGMSAEKADKHLQIETGIKITEGDLLAGPVGFAQRKVRAPCNGRVVLAGSGQVLIEVDRPVFSLKAALPGEVVDLLPDRGVVIETTGSLIQGVWGNGAIEQGLMSVLLKEPDQRLTPDALDVSMRGTIVLGGYVDNEEVLKMAAETPLRGLILSSMSPALVPLAQHLSVPILLLEGFGDQPMGAAAYKLLSTNERREVALNAENWDPYLGTRPEIVISLPASSAVPLPREADHFAAGQAVRMIRAPQKGKNGTLISLKGMVTFASGLRLPAADIRLEGGEMVVTPLANLELLE